MYDIISVRSTIRTVQVRRGEPNARNEIRGSFARASRCRGYITRVLTRVMTPIHQDASAMTECFLEGMSARRERSPSFARMSWLAFSYCKLCVFILQTYCIFYLDISVIHMGESFLHMARIFSCAL
jgi:hypothetical protein